MKSEELSHFRDILRQMQRSLGWLAKSDAACCGVTVSQCHALLEIGKTGTITLIDLAAALALDTSTISRTVDSMVKDDLVERKADPDDRRYLRLTLTKKGQNIYDEINCTFNLYYKEIFTGIPEDKHAAIIESIEILTNALTDKNNVCCREELHK
ncbi:MAG: MarR family transcriptional regulator [Bacillota bacterium]|nr:MarR family transcriptional regulator [Bacillota bacterium]MDW7729514.1 MarR family transcriptional regulator [Bacillota bacterium]